MTHFLALTDRSAGEIGELLDRAAAIKSDRAAHRAVLDGRTLAMIFQKRSTRTRVSFEVGMKQLGGDALFLSSDDLQLGRGETVEDTARVLARYVDAIMARVFAHEDLEKLTAGGIPVINGLSDRLHPCQALADLLTIRERLGRLEGVTLAYLGDGNNVCHSLINAAALAGLRLRVGAPEGFEPDVGILTDARGRGADVEVTHDPAAAIAGADAVYTDVWASMGQEEEAAERRRVFTPFRVDEALFAKAAPEAIFLHCLPAHRGDEVTDGVVDHPRSAVLDQAENRMHAQKALLVEVMGERESDSANPRLRDSGVARPRRGADSAT